MTGLPVQLVPYIHKKGSKADVSNYRPISLTCIICKILESLIRDHIMDYFNKNNLFSNKQFGFIKGRDVPDIRQCRISGNVLGYPATSGIRNPAKKYPAKTRCFKLL